MRQPNPQPRLTLNDLEYLECRGLNVMLAHDYYPEGHQGGVGIVQNGLRVATNGDLRLEPTPGQWSPVPKVGPRQVDHDRNEISVRMQYPDEAKNRRGFNPIDYPDLSFAYTLRVHPEGEGFRIVVDLDEPLPESWVGRVGFNLELFPGYLFGKTYATGESCGIFPRQAIGPGTLNSQGVFEPLPLAVGRQLTIAPESDGQRLKVEAKTGGDLQLLDGRGLHNNGWFVVRALIEFGAASRAIEWTISPNVVPNWISPPVIQVSQVGYKPGHPKFAVVEIDRNDHSRPNLEIERIGHGIVLSRSPEVWGRFLRYDYLRLDFSDVREPGMYRVLYAGEKSSPFRIADDVFDRGVWQPTVDTFLPVQMCHMRVNENYRVWHGACHMDDALMAPTDLNHLDGYKQGPDTLCAFRSGDHVPGLNRGGWHDAGDYDIRVESQAQTVHGLSLAYERFGLDYDNTSIDQTACLVELMRPDGKSDVLQQIEHGCLAIVGGYRALGRLYRGMIEPKVGQYTHLGDAATQTDNLRQDSALGLPDDDRWVFTEENPVRELEVGAALAAASRVLRGFNDPLAADCLSVAESVYRDAQTSDPAHRVSCALELLLCTQSAGFRDLLLLAVNAICADPSRLGWLGARAIQAVGDDSFTAQLHASLKTYADDVRARSAKTPYGVPYEPDIWGAGWGIQRFGVQQYWLHSCFPEIFPAIYMLNALSFVLRCHPGSNTASFVSGVGSRSMIPGYGVNRADESYIPGGVGSGTALIRPDFPEFLEWPYLWQQTEYCIGNATADYVFLVAAAASL